MKIAIGLPLEEIKEFCQKWKIKEFALFGSVLRDDFNIQKSDVDILITFQEEAVFGWELVDMKDELKKIFNRRVDLLEKKVIEKSKNPYRKQGILGSCEVIYEQAA